AFLLLAMNERNFVVAVAYGKTEVLQVALFATVFLQELPGLAAASAMVMSTAGVIILSLPKTKGSAGPQARAWFSKAAAYGLVSGSCQALAAVTSRGASLSLHGLSPWLMGAWNVVIAQCLQSICVGGYLAVTKPQALTALMRSWRVSVLAGMM